MRMVMARWESHFGVVKFRLITMKFDFLLDAESLLAQ
jgi:hypothetical protein